MTQRIDHLIVIDKFPDYTASGFDEEAHDRQFRNNNVIIKADSKHVAFPEHWGPLSIKCCSGGKEHYTIGPRFYSVDDSHFLVLNNGQWYSSYIYSGSPVSSFTINFCAHMQQEIIHSLLDDDAKNLLSPEPSKQTALTFTEKLYEKDHDLRRMLDTLKQLAGEHSKHSLRIEELLYLLFEKLMFAEKRIVDDMRKLDVLKPSTQSEIYKRLHFVKDYMDSCYPNDISLGDLANVAHLNGAYLLRKFKNFFSVTPRQYLIKKRMEVASEMLKFSDLSVTEVCNEVGYSDLTSFSKLFKHLYQYSPGKYRMLNRVKHIVC